VIADEHFEIRIAMFHSIYSPLIHQKLVDIIFWNAKTNEGESADFAHFDPKIGCHGNVP